MANISNGRGGYRSDDVTWPLASDKRPKTSRPDPIAFSCATVDREGATEERGCRLAAHALPRYSLKAFVAYIASQRPEVDGQKHLVGLLESPRNPSWYSSATRLKVKGHNTSLPCLEVERQEIKKRLLEGSSMISKFRMISIVIHFCSNRNSVFTKIASAHRWDSTSTAGHVRDFRQADNCSKLGDPLNTPPSYTHHDYFRPVSTTVIPSSDIVALFLEEGILHNLQYLAKPTTFCHLLGKFLRRMRPTVHCIPGKQEPIMASPLDNLAAAVGAALGDIPEEQAEQIRQQQEMAAYIQEYPDFEKPFNLTTDASNIAIAGILSQNTKGGDLPIAYASRTLSDSEKNLSTIEKECLAVVWATHHFRPYLFGRKFKIFTDHRPLQWLFSLKEPSSKLFRWRLKLEEYDYEIHYKKGTANANADALSRVEIQNNETNSPNSPNSPSIDYLTDPEQVRQILGWEQCSTPPIHVDPRTIISDPDEIQRVIGEKLENAGVENDTMSVIDELVNRRHDELVQDRSDQSLVVNLDESDRLTEDSSVAPTVHSNYEGNTTFAIPISDKPVNHSNHQILKSELIDLKELTSFRVFVGTVKNLIDHHRILLDVILDAVQDIDNSLTFCKLGALHPSIISPHDLSAELRKISEFYPGRLLPFHGEMFFDLQPFVKTKCAIGTDEIIYFLDLSILAVRLEGLREECLLHASVVRLGQSFDEMAGAAFLGKIITIASHRRSTDKIYPLILVALQNAPNEIKSRTFIVYIYREHSECYCWIPAILPSPFWIIPMLFATRRRLAVWSVEGSEYRFGEATARQGSYFRLKSRYVFSPKCLGTPTKFREGPRSRQALATMLAHANRWTDSTHRFPEDPVPLSCFDPNKETREGEGIGRNRRRFTNTITINSAKNRHSSSHFISPNFQTNVFNGRSWIRVGSCENGFELVMRRGRGLEISHCSIVLRMITILPSTTPATSTGCSRTRLVPPESATSSRNFLWRGPSFSFFHDLVLWHHEEEFSFCCIFRTTKATELCWSFNCSEFRVLSEWSQGVSAKNLSFNDFLKKKKMLGIIPTNFLHAITSELLRLWSSGEATIAANFMYFRKSNIVSVWEWGLVMLTSCPRCQHTFRSSSCCCHAQCPCSPSYPAVRPPPISTTGGLQSSSRSAGCPARPCRRSHSPCFCSQSRCPGSPDPAPSLPLSFVIPCPPVNPKPHVPLALHNASEFDLHRLSVTVGRLKASGWYYEGLTWQESITLLSPTSPGTFLVRESSNPSYLFSLSVQAEKGPTSVRIHYVNGYFRLDAEPSILPAVPLFDCVIKMVEYYVCTSQEPKSNKDLVFLDRSGSKYSSILLKKPLINQPSKLQHLARLKVNEQQKNNGDPVPILGLPVTLRNYLKEYPYTN
ncbi:unnamed protein product [Nesidiocoris tenuis]|uniref:Suppressor of cytokine signaling 2 n=1 Tax=Nesidiocoris tenuis TaxID=355587 RepID=A0A6H5H4V2_9HEMI|nr:unnamed protein product [Nesidiocoris tenuis]